VPSDHDLDTAGPAAPRPDPALCCWFCGYELYAADLPTQNFACPECGNINLPHDPHCAPYAKRRWPHPLLTLLMLGWPGLLVGLLICLALTYQPALGAIVALLILPQCLLWPISITDTLLHLRVPGMSRTSSRRLFLLGGIFLNLALCFLLPWLLFRLS